MVKRDYKDIWAMLTRIAGPLGKEDLKEIMCESVSDGRTNSLTELSEVELTALRVELKKQTKSGYGSNSDLKKKRGQVLRQMQKYGIDTRNWDAVNAFCRDNRIAGKEFGQLTIDELEELRRKMYSINRKNRERNSKKVEVKVPRSKPKRKKLVIYSPKPFSEIVGNSKHYN